MEKYLKLIDKINKKVDTEDFYLDLVREVNRYADSHFEDDINIISDYEYDVLYNYLVYLEENNSYKCENSPTIYIRGESTGKLNTVKHLTPILSLDKANTSDDIYKYLNRMNKYKGFSNDKFLVENKEDGLTAVLYYSKEFKNSKNVIILSRGDGGKEGEDLTYNTLNLPTIPTLNDILKHLKDSNYNYKLDKFAIRGEFIIDNKTFDKINNEISDEDKKYKSPRNLASGSVRTLDSNIALSRGVKFSAYNIEDSENLGFKEELDMIKFLDGSGFDVVSYKVFDNTKDGNKALVDYCITFDEKVRDSIDHIIDGLVIKPNLIIGRGNIGNTKKFPKWAIAYKFTNKKSVSKLLGVTWQVGKTGQISPVGHVNPVAVDGAVINKASLSNINIINKAKIHINDDVIVERRNGVIPKITGVDSESKSREVINIPNECPVCKGDVYLEGDILYCNNAYCEGKWVRKLENFVSKNAMDIDSLGSKLINQLFDEGIINKYSDIYKLKSKREDLLKLDRMGEKKVDKILSNIESSKEKGMYYILVGLGDKNFGKDISEKLAKKYNKMFELLEFAKKENFVSELVKMDGVGETTAITCKKVLTNDIIADELHELDKLGLNMLNTLEEVSDEEIESSKLYGKTVVITGTLSDGRSAIKKVIEGLGGKVTGSVTGKTDYLLVGEGAENSSKYKKAVSLGVDIIKEDFLKDY